MKIDIGKYPEQFSGHTLLEKLGFENEEVDIDERHPILFKIASFVADISNKTRKRKVKIQIDPWDTWNLDHTLALIIHPALVQLKETKHGSPITDAEDSPEHITDIHEQWEFVINEMIFAFEKIKTDDFDIWEFEKDSDEGKRLSNGLRLFGKYYLGLWD